MKNKNENSTRYYSTMHENYVAKTLNGKVVSNSGAGKFSGGDVVHKDASMLIECKTCMTEKNSFSIKKEWLIKNETERKQVNLDSSCLCFNFGPNTDNYYIINEKLMKFLIEKLENEN